MKQKLKLVLPSRKYAPSLFKMLEAFRKEGNTVASARGDFFLSLNDYPKFKRRITEDRKEVNLEKGRVGETLYLGVIGNKVVGKLAVRHKLNKNLKAFGGHIGYTVNPADRRKGYATEMLRQALPKVKKLGIKKVLITCKDTNIASRKVIEWNGGVYENKVKTKEGYTLLRFWINIK